MTGVPGLDRFPFGQVATWLSEGEIVPFLGSGASLVGTTGSPHLPDGRGLADELITAMEGAFPGAAGVELATAAQFFQHSVFDRSALYERLRERFEVQQRNNTPAVVAQTLASLPRADRPLFIITTNYDSFVERAFRTAGRPICVITQNLRDPEKGATRIALALPDGTTTEDESMTFQWNDQRRFPRDTAFLFKMHGSVHRATPEGQDDVIITEDDYVDFMVNSGGATSPFFPPASLTAAYKQRRFLFMGYSLQDWNFRVFLRVLAARNALSGRELRRHWAIQRAPASLDVELWRQRNVSVYDGDLAEFCARLSRSFSPEADR